MIRFLLSCLCQGGLEGALALSEISRHDTMTGRHKFGNETVFYLALPCTRLDTDDLRWQLAEKDQVTLILQGGT